LFIIFFCKCFNNLLMKIFLTCLHQIQNGIKIKKEYIFVKKNKNLFLFLDLLVREGFIHSYVVISEKIKIFLKYKINGQPIIGKIKFVSVVSRLIFLKQQQQQYNSSASVCILSTSSGYRVYTVKQKLNLKIIGNSGKIMCVLQ
jgi:ribosomal protein S8